jgi:hypothetical protein
MSDKPGPEEPTDLSALEQELELSYLDEEAVHMHELYKSFIRAGFRERQSLLLVAMIANDAADDGVYMHDMEIDDEESSQDEDLDPDSDFESDEDFPQ